MRLSPARSIATVGLAALMPCYCAAQSLPTTVQVSSTGTLNLEPAFIISPGSPTERLVAWQQSSSDGAIHCAVSLNGGASWGPDTALAPFTVTGGPGGPCTVLANGDAAVAAAINNGKFDLYAGGTANQGRYLIARKPSGSATVTPISLVAPCGDAGGDKGFLTGYPGPGLVASDLLLIGFDIGAPMYSAHSIDTSPAGSSWPQSSGTPGYPSVVPTVFGPHPLGAFPLGIRGGQFNGRVVMGYSPSSGFGLAAVAFTDIGGENGDWRNFHQFLFCVDPATGATLSLSSIGLPGSQPIPGRGPNGENDITIFG